MSDWIDEAKKRLAAAPKMSPSAGPPWAAVDVGLRPMHIDEDAARHVAYAGVAFIAHAPDDLRRALDVAEAARDAVRIADVISAGKRAGLGIEQADVERANAIVDRLRAALRGGA